MALLLAAMFLIVCRTVGNSVHLSPTLLHACFNKDVKDIVPVVQGFTHGIMIVGEYAGRKVSEVKPIIKDLMVKAGHAILYSEPESKVMSRSGESGIVRTQRDCCHNTLMNSNFCVMLQVMNVLLLSRINGI